MSCRWTRLAAAVRVAISPISTDPPKASPVSPPTRETIKAAQSSAATRATVRRSPPHGPSSRADRIQRTATYTGVAHGERPARNSAPTPSPGVAAGKSGPISTGARRPTAGARSSTAGWRGTGTTSTALTETSSASARATPPKTPRRLSRMMARRRSAVPPARPSIASASPSRCNPPVTIFHADTRRTAPRSGGTRRRSTRSAATRQAPSAKPTGGNHQAARPRAPASAASRPGTGTIVRNRRARTRYLIGRAPAPPSHRRNGIAARREFELLALRVREAAGQLTPQLGARDDAIDEHLRGELVDVHVLHVLLALLLHVGGSLALRQLHDLVVVDGVDGRLRPHDGDLPLGKREGGVGLEGGAAHGVEARAIALAHDHGDLGHGGLGGGEDHLGAVTDDPRPFHLGPHHEAGDVGEIDEGDVEGVAQPDEARGLVRGVDHEDATLDLGLVGHDAHGAAADAREAGDDLLSEEPLDLEERACVDDAVDELVHVEPLALIVRHDLFHRPSRRGLARGHRCGTLAIGRGHEAQIALGDLDGLLVGGGEDVAAARDGAVHARAPQFLQGDLLAHRHLDHARRAHVETRFAVHHDHAVGEGGKIGGAGGRRAEEDAHLRDDSGELHLVVEDAAGVEPPWEDLDLLGDAPACRVDQVEERHLEALRALLDAHDLRHRLLAPGASLHRVVVGHDAHHAAAHPAHSSDHAVGGSVRLLAAREEEVLLELRSGVEEEAEAIADEELAFFLQLVAVLDVALLDASALSGVALLSHGGPPGGSLRRGGDGDGIGPENDDEHARAVTGAPHDGGCARRGHDVGGHDRLLALEQAHLHAHRFALEVLGSDLEPAIVRSGDPLGYAELHVDLVVLERRVVAIAKKFAQSRD